QLECCIATVARSDARNLGFNFLMSNSHNFLGSQIGNLIALPAVAVKGGAKTFNVPPPPQANLFFGVTGDNSAFFGFLEALQEEQLVKVLASPTLITYSGRPADFLVGGEVPVPAATGLAANPNVAFKPFGVRLTFVPVVLGDGKIRLDVLPEVSAPTNAQSVVANGVSVPSFITQRLHTTVELES